VKKTEEEIAKVVARAAMIDASTLRPETTLSGLGIDSLARIECVLSLEEIFQVELNEADFWKLRTLQDVIDAVNQALSQSRS
jgi:acyl carrier protein